MNRELDEFLDYYRDVKGNTILILQEIQNRYRYLPEDVLHRVSERNHIPLSELYGVATFYSQFKFNRPGELQIKACHGTACHINNAVRISEIIEDQLGVAAGETTVDGKFSLDDVACLGCCSLAPVIMINEKVYGKLDDKKLRKVLNSY